MSARIHRFRTFVWCLLPSLLVGSCASDPAIVFEKSKFYQSSFVLVEFRKYRDGRGVRYKMTESEVGRMMAELMHVQPPVGEMEDIHYAAILFVGSSFESQKLWVCLDKNGEGYFRSHKGHSVRFRSETLRDIFSSVETLAPDLLDPLEALEAISSPGK